MKVTEFLSQCRKHLPSLPGADLLAEVRCQIDHRPTDDDDDPNAVSRYLVLLELNRTLTDQDRPLVHYLIRQEILYLALCSGVNESIKLGAYLLFRLGHVEDSLVIWDAKTTTFDTHCGVDVQLLVAAGVDVTLAWLKHHNSLEAQRAANWIEKCASTGDFRDLEGYREFASRYFANV